MSDSEILITISQQLGRVEGSVEGLRGEIAGVRKDVRSLGDKVDDMPDQWSEDITKALKACQKSRDDVSEAIDLTEERMRAKYGKKDSYPTPTNLRRDSWISSTVKDVLRPFITLLIVAAVAGTVSLVTTRCGSDPQNLQFIKETPYALQKLSEEVQGVQDHLDTIQNEEEEEEILNEETQP